MLVHPGAGQTINVLNAWPTGWNAQFKLWGPQKTWITGDYTGGKFSSLTVSPKARVADVLINGTAPSGVTVTGSDDAGGYIGPSLTQGNTTPGNSGGTGGTGKPPGGGGVDGTSGSSTLPGTSGNGQTTGGVGSPGAGGSDPGNPGVAGASGTNTSNGCGCRAAGDSRPGTSAGWLLAALVPLLRRRRRG
jgi:MYXO-CTERM domain-containing protein